MPMHGKLFGASDDRARAFQAAQAQIQRVIDGVSEDELLEADFDRWADELAGEAAVEVPTVRSGDYYMNNLGPKMIDCTGWPGIAYTTLEWGNVIRPGFEFEIHIPVDGPAELLRSRTRLGGTGIDSDVVDGEIVRVWEWPEVYGTERFEEEVRLYVGEIVTHSTAAAEEIESFNATLREFAAKAMNERRSRVLARREFLGGLKLPVRTAPDAPKAFQAPPLKRIETPARRLVEHPAASEGEPELGEFYEHILDVIRAVGRGLERSPGSFSDAGEETLRDHMLVTLNTHYVGRTYAEAFNRAGKTDILIRVHDRNAFIGECKWWHGAKALNEALDQLFGYTTWRDSRVALIFYVRAKGITGVIDKAREELAARGEFSGWEPTTMEGELRCKVTWPDDPQRHAILTALFVHLAEPRSDDP
jgi:hypothetical protein